MRKIGYVAACLVGGEYVQLGPFRRKRDSIVAGSQLPIYEIIFVDRIRETQRVVDPLLYGYAKPHEIAA